MHVESQVAIDVFAVLFLLAGVTVANTDKGKAARCSATNLRTGDILLFKTKGRRNVLDWLASDFSHAGIVFAWAGRTYVLEAREAEGPRDVAGVHLEEATRRVQRYDGEVWVSKATPQNLDPWRLMQKIPQYCELEYDASYRSTILFGRQTSERKVFCSELVVSALHDLGVPTGLRAARTTPDALLKVHSPRVLAQLK
jgi:hypothetical protein